MRQLTEPVILSVSGRDRPGILAVLAGKLAEHGIELVDIEQATLQDFLAVSFLVDLGSGGHSARAILREFVPEARSLGLSVELRPISQEELRSLDEKDLWALTVLGAGDIAGTVATVAGIVASHGANITSVRRLAEEDLSAAEFILDASRVQKLSDFRRDLLSHAEQAGADIALAREAAYRRSKRVVVMDADSTLVAGEVIDELAARAGVAEQVRSITDSAMEGNRDFTASLRERVALLAGLDERVLEEVAAAMPLTPGAEETISSLKALGLKVAVISGGFTFFTDRLAERLGLDYAFANRLGIEDGKLTGKLVGPILDAEGKADRLMKIAEAEGVHRSQVVAVGDGANDIPMLQKAGLGVAFQARPATREAADAAIHGQSTGTALSARGLGEGSGKAT